MENSEPTPNETKNASATEEGKTIAIIAYFPDRKL